MLLVCLLEWPYCRLGLGSPQHVTQLRMANGSSNGLLALNENKTTKCHRNTVTEKYHCSMEGKQYQMSFRRATGMRNESYLRMLMSYAAIVTLLWWTWMEQARSMLFCSSDEWPFLKGWWISIVPHPTQPSRLSTRPVGAVGHFDLATWPTGSRVRRGNHILNM